MAILYVAAEAAELEPFAARLEGLRKLKWPIDYAFEGVLGGRRMLLAANGAGPKLAERAVEIAIRAVSQADLSASKLEAIVSTGYCGALDPQLRECQMVVGTEVLDLANGETWECGVVEECDGALLGPVVAQDAIAHSVEDKAFLRTRGAIAVDMESNSIASRTKRAGLPFYCIRVVSDRADESFAIDMNQMRTPEGRVSRGKIIIYVITHPKLLPELLRLKRRSEAAAIALGDFLVRCRIKPESGSPTVE